MFETNFVNMEKQPLLSMKNASVSRSLLASFLGKYDSLKLYYYINEVQLKYIISFPVSCFQLP